MLEKYSQLVVRSINDVHMLSTPTLNSISNTYSHEEAAAIAVMEVAGLVNFINVGKTMDRDQVVESSKFIVSEYGFLTIADFKLFFAKFKKGHYGKQYDRLDGQVIIQALDQYISDRSEVIGELTAKDYYRHEKEIRNNPSKRYEGLDEKFIAIVSSAVKDMTKPKTIQPAPEPNKDDIGQKWIRQFNNLHRKYGIQSGIRMIKIGRTVLDITDFLNRKALNYEKMDKQG